eukprot:Nitzschia sp. Nitz4//scaffold29_size155292//15575//16595//NITZ4_002636-RA/size155292-processed-gene-0.238-mRNA-1//1//CDS//3329546382//7271//frame0
MEVVTNCGSLPSIPVFESRVNVMSGSDHVGFDRPPWCSISHIAKVMKCKVITIHKANEVPREPIEGKPTLVYWDIIGIVHQLRMALAMSGVEWCDVRMVCGQGSDVMTNKQEWFQAKQKLLDDGIMDFPNLPYYMDKDVTLVQSDAILRYLGKKHNLLGTSVPEHVSDMLMEEARDLDGTLARLSYAEGDKAVANWLSSESLRDKLNIWNECHIQKTPGEFVTGSTPTLVDLRFYAFLFKFQKAQAHLTVKSMMTQPSIQVPALPFFVPAYLEKVKRATPQLEEYLNSPEMNIPTNNPHARFDNL